MVLVCYIFFPLRVHVSAVLALVVSLVPIFTSIFEKSHGDGDRARKVSVISNGNARNNPVRILPYRSIRSGDGERLRDAGRECRGFIFLLHDRDRTPKILPRQERIHRRQVHEGIRRKDRSETKSALTIIASSSSDVLMLYLPRMM